MDYKTEIIQMLDSADNALLKYLYDMLKYITSK